MAVRFLLDVRQAGRHPLLVLVRGHLMMGRDCDGLLLADPQVSRVHAEFIQREDQLLVADLGSTNGTSVNGRPTAGPDPVAVGDVVRLGDTEVRVVAQHSETDGDDAVTERDQSDQSETRHDRSGDGSVHTAAWQPPGFGAPQAKVLGPSPDGDFPDTEALDMTQDESGIDLRTKRRSASQDADPRDTGIDSLLAEIDREPIRLAARGGDGTVTLAVAELIADGRSEHGKATSEERSPKRVLVTPLLAEHGGRRLAGDERASLLAFPSPRRALQWATLRRAALVASGRDTRRPQLHLRVGMHVAGYDPTDRTALTRMAKRSAAIAQAAGRGEILVSVAVRDIEIDRDDARFGLTRLVPDGPDGGLLEVAALDTSIAFPSA